METPITNEQPDAAPVLPDHREIRITLLDGSELLMVASVVRKAEDGTTVYSAPTGYELHTAGWKLADLEILKA